LSMDVPPETPLLFTYKNKATRQSSIALAESTSACSICTQQSL